MGNIAKLPISLLYSQVCVFDPGLEQPLNDWTAQHVAQGFSWRPGSVSFATTFESGECTCVVEIGPNMPPLDGALLAIAVPFDVPAHGNIEVGSIMGGTIVTMPAGSYRLAFLDYGSDSQKFRLVLIPAGDREPAVLREFGNVKRQNQYLLNAEPA